MSLLLVKLILAPLLILAATLAARRWGPAIGGWLAGLPLKSGPISVFLALEQGREFAATAGMNSIFGIAAVSAFCLAYAKSARRFSWPIALFCASIAYFLSLFLLSLAPPTLPVAVALAVALLGAALFAIGRPAAKPVPVLSPWWDLPLRMVCSVGLLLLVTGIAEHIGPKWSGLISPFPVLVIVLGVFVHFQSGAAATHQFMRGTLSGSFAFVAFFVVVTLTIRTVSLPVVYLLASIVAVAINFAMLRLVQERKE